MLKYLGLIAVLMFGTALAAQATSPVSGTYAGSSDEQHMFLFDIDFGAVATPHAVTLSVAGDSTTEGLDAFLGDVDALAATGATGSTDTGSDAGTGTVNLSVTTASHIGVHQFVVSIRSLTGNGPVNFTGSIDVATLGAGDITVAETNVHVGNGITVVNKLLSRAMDADWDVNSSGDTQPMEALIDFGATSQPITFWFNGGGDIAGDLEVQEVLANGTTSTLGTVTGATTDWEDEANLTTSSRSGVVRIRVIADTANLDFRWTIVLPNTATFADYQSIVINENLAIDDERIVLFSVDFGPVASTVMVQFASFSGSGFSFALIDLDELATNGSATGVITPQEAMYLSGQGVKQFLVSIEEDTGAATTASMTLLLSVLSGQATKINTVNVSDPTPFTRLLGRAVLEDVTTTAAQTITRDFKVDYGTPAHTANMWFQLDAPAGVTVELLEIDAGGTPVSLSTLTLSNEANLTSSSRSGEVTFRVIITTTGAAADIDYAVVFDSSVTVAAAPGGGGGGGDDDGGCAANGTGFSGALWLLLLAIPTLVWFRRRTA